MKRDKFQKEQYASWKAERRGENSSLFALLKFVLVEERTRSMLYATSPKDPSQWGARPFAAQGPLAQGDHLNSLFLQTNVNDAATSCHSKTVGLTICQLSKTCIVAPIQIIAQKESGVRQEPA